MELINKKEFDKLTNAEKRVAIAQDVIERVNNSLIQALQGAPIGELQGRREDKSLQNVLNSFQCEACAKGALFCSWVGNFNEVDWRTFRSLSETDDASRFLPEELKEIFGARMLAIIEAAFEGQSYSWHEEHEDDSKRFTEYLGCPYECYEQGDRFEDKESLEVAKNNSNERLLKIMQNIVDNKGEFII